MNEPIDSSAADRSTDLASDNEHDDQIPHMPHEEEMGNDEYVRRHREQPETKAALEEHLRFATAVAESRGQAVIGQTILNGHTSVVILSSPSGPRLDSDPDGPQNWYSDEAGVAGWINELGDVPDAQIEYVERRSPILPDDLG